jgi:hypothetical protein
MKRFTLPCAEFRLHSASEQDTDRRKERMADAARIALVAIRYERRRALRRGLPRPHVDERTTFEGLRFQEIVR